MTELLREPTVVLATPVVCSTPPETRRSRIPSEIFSVELPWALKRREMGETGVEMMPVKPVWSEIFSALFQVVTSSLRSVLTATILAPVRKLPVAVAKLVTPEPSVTVVAAPSTPTSPEYTSFRVVVVMPLTELWVPLGSVRRIVPARRETIGPRFRTIGWLFVAVTLIAE